MSNSRENLIKKTAEEEAAKFTDAGFGQVDWSGFPEVRPVKEEEFRDEDEHGFNNVDISRSASLRKPLENFVETAADDPKLAKELRAAGVDTPGLPHRFIAGDWKVTIQFRRGKWHVRALGVGAWQQEKAAPIQNADADDAIDLESLKDAEIEQLTSNTRRLHAQQTRRTPGILQ